MNAIDYFERLGIPLGILAVVGWAVWRIVVWLADNAVKPVVEEHRDFLKETKKTQKVNAVSQRRTAKAIEKLASKCPGSGAAVLVFLFCVATAAAQVQPCPPGG